MACSVVLPRKQNTLGLGGINESGRGEAVEEECSRGGRVSGGDLIYMVVIIID